MLAPHIGARIGARLAEAGINYVDRHGHCHLAVGSLYVHVEGRTGPPHDSSDEGLRSPGYQVLFARRRLLDEGDVVETKSGCRWVDCRRDDA